MWNGYPGNWAYQQGNMNGSSQHNQGPSTSTPRNLNRAQSESVSIMRSKSPSPQKSNSKEAHGSRATNTTPAASSPRHMESSPLGDEDTLEKDKEEGVKLIVSSILFSVR